MQSRMRTQKGFTLIELVVVIAVLAILAGVAIPKFMDITTRAQDAAEKADVGTIRQGIMNVAVTTSIGPPVKALSASYPTSLGDLSTANKTIFDKILEPAAAADFFERGWTGAGTSFRSPGNNAYTYTAGTGQFQK